jgi:hypothetical protein
MTLYEKLKSHQEGKNAPPGFRIADYCCGTCMYCYDEGSVTACMKYEWFPVDWFNECDNYDGGKH